MNSSQQSSQSNILSKVGFSTKVKLRVNQELDITEEAFICGFFYEHSCLAKYQFKACKLLINFSDKLYICEPVSYDCYSHTIAWNEYYFLNVRQAFVISDHSNYLYVYKEEIVEDEGGLMDITEYYLEIYNIYDNKKVLLFKTKITEIFESNQVDYVLNFMLTIFNEEDTISSELLYDNKRLYNEMNILKESINNEIDKNNKQNDEDIIKFMLIYDEKESIIKNSN